MRRSIVLASLALVPFLLAACGGSSDDGGGGAGGASGSAGSGGAAGSGGSGGTAGSGGSAGASGDASVEASDGAAGDGGAGGGAGDGAAEASDACADPTDASKAALCLVVQPDAITFVPGDPAFDGKGVLAIDLFDTPSPDLPDGGTVTPLASVLLPVQSSDGGISEADLATLAAQPIRFDDLPPTVYARVFFADDTSMLVSPQDGPRPGLWVGGIDFSNGIADHAPLEPIALQTGQGTTAPVALHPLRKLTVTVDRTASPIGDGQGPLSVVAIDSQTPSSTSQIFGYASLDCADLSGSGTVTVSGFVLGPGPHWLAAVLNDLGVQSNDLPPGSLTSLEPSGGTLQIPAGDQLTYAADAYETTASITLGLAVPAGDAGGDGVTCSAPSDAGAD